MRNFAFILLLIFSIKAQAATFIETYPHLKQFEFKEPKSPYYFGIGAAPLGTLQNRLMFAANFFQVHRISEWWDIELLNASLAFTVGQPSYTQSTHLVLRMSPKIRLAGVLSLGPLVGYEYVSFADVSSKLTKNQFTTPQEPFSTKGPIWGFMLSETFKRDNGYQIKINQVAYRQTYSTEKTDLGWAYLFDRKELRQDRSPIEASYVFMLEAALLF